MPRGGRTSSRPEVFSGPIGPALGLNLARTPGYSLRTASRTRRGVSALHRFRYLFFLIAGLLFAAASLGKGSQTDILIQSTNDVFNELAPCG